MRHYIGGMFAPPLDDDKLQRYEQLFTQTLKGSQLNDALMHLLSAVKHWWSEPESSQTESRPHPIGFGTIIPLDKDIKTRLSTSLPWEDQIHLYDQVLETIEPGELRHAAFHILWHVKELCLDREPLTMDKLPPRA